MCFLQFATIFHSRHCCTTMDIGVSAHASDYVISGLQCCLQLGAGCQDFAVHCISSKSTYCILCPEYTVGFN